ncbi:alpha-2,8-sialyltransferase 8F-like [Nerophis ophidion]|uniref:alpha-2,8-sialyltransferase 8F-like n=1 Tax=Nerophis ophidion TaxID=159077 RepID=UPI002ADF30D0|nr:alpha-2,8-sialyltransferase 8F-like [Nerophis ophidion]
MGITRREVCWPETWASVAKDNGGKEARSMRSGFVFTFALLCVGSLLAIVTWYMFQDDNTATSPSPRLCDGCKELIDDLLKRYSQTWKQSEENYQTFTSKLSSLCRVDKAIITQDNTPVGTKISFDGEKSDTLQIEPEIFRTFIKEHPFSNQMFNTCAVVGNGGILMDSGCGKMIDSAQFVIRCNLPPLNGEYGKHVGVKTDLVTANPSILEERYGSLMNNRRGFADSLLSYGKSFILLPAFSVGDYTPLSLRVAYTVEDFASLARPVFFNPDYLRNLSRFWAGHGLKSPRLSTGIMMASMALGACSNVHLYGFWPFANHPHRLYALTNHYYDDRKVDTKFHAMPEEFDMLLKLHSQGVLRLHLGDCQSAEK